MTKQFRSRLEEQFMTRHGKHVEGYEVDKIPYNTTHKYNPDFKILDNLYVETKGRFESQDRTKIKSVLLQNPGITIVMVFQNPKSKLEGSETTYAQWCDKHNIPWFAFQDTMGIETYLKRKVQEYKASLPEKSTGMLEKLFEEAIQNEITNTTTGEVK